MRNNLQKTQLIVTLVAVLMAIIFIFGSLIPYIQMNQYRSVLVNGGTHQDVLEKNSIFNPHTAASDLVCIQIIGSTNIPITKTVEEMSPDAKIYVPFLQNILIRCEESLSHSPDPVNRFLISTIYNYLGHITNEKDYFDKSDALIVGITAQSPERQVFHEFKGVNLFFKRDFVAAKKEFSIALSANKNAAAPTYYLNLISGFGIK